MANSVESKAAEELEKLLTLGGDFLQEGKVAEARTCFEDALLIAADDEKVLGLLGLTHFRMSDFESASGVYRRLVKKKPEDASYRLNFGLVHLKLGRAKQAIEELSASHKLDPEQVRTVSYLGLAYARNGEYAEAYEAFLRAEETSLASEMEQHLEVSQRKEIRQRVLAHAEKSRSADFDFELAFSGADDDESSEDAPPDTDVVESAPAAEDVAEVASEVPSEESSEVPSEESSATEAEAEETVAESTSDEQDTATTEESVVESAIPSLRPEEGAITRAVDGAIPYLPASGLKSGHSPPLKIGEFTAQRLLRPSDSGETLEIGAGGVLIAQVNGKLISRTHGVMVSSGELGFEPATRRIRGQQSDEIFGTGQEKLFLVTGQGYMVASARGEVFTALRLDDDIVYLREEYIFAFEPGLRWENGRVPGTNFHVAQFRGHGCLAMRTPKELLSVRLTSERVMYVESDVIAGWIGKVVPRFVKPAAGGDSSTSFIECSGEGVVLMHDLQAIT